LPSSSRHVEGSGMKADFEPDVLQEISESDALRVLMEPGDVTSGD
jgi:hypothetical protein